MNTHVLNLTLKDHGGGTLSVQDSCEDIEFTIPREVTSGNVISHFVKPSSEGKMQYHKLSVSSLTNNGANLTLTVSMITRWITPYQSLYISYSTCWQNL